MKHAVTAVLAVLLVSTIARAEIPDVMGYQGRITDNSGVPVSDGTYTMRFRIYDAETVGNLEWDSGDVSVSVSDGVFNVMLGESPQPALGLGFDEDYWLAVTFDGEDQVPRKRLGSVGYAYMASGVVPGTEVSGVVLGGTNAALKGTNTAVGDTAYGIAGESASIMGRGVMGEATAPGGANFGVYGVSASSAGRGVYGEASATSGSTYGGLFVSQSDEGVGVHGRATDLEGSTCGVEGEVLSSHGRGVYGFASAPTGITYGGFFESQSQSGRAVYGSANAPTGYTYGVYGYSNSTDGRGVCGEAARTSGTTYGVYGYSASAAGRGVYGYTNASSGATYGGYFVSASASGTGVYGEASATTGYTYGLYGETSSTSGRGVYGRALATSGDAYGGYFVSSSEDEGAGVYGFAAVTSGIAYGGRLVSSAPYGAGVYGSVTTTDGPAYGVYGDAASVWCSGVKGYGGSDAAMDGVYGQAMHSSGYAVYASGNFAASGSKSCVVRTSRGPTMLYCQESPENWFEDFGSGWLEAGRGHVELDPLFLETVTIDASNPMLVYVQLSGECEGVYVRKGTTGFDVIELRGGSSSEPFDYRVVAKRKGYEEHRLQVAPRAYTDRFLYRDIAQVPAAYHDIWLKSGPLAERARFGGPADR